MSERRRPVRQLDAWVRPVVGACGSDLVEGRSLALEAWGERAQEPGTGFAAFAYLYRRFGPPAAGCDPHKDLAAYHLTTQDPEVFLWLGLGSSAAVRSVGYLITESLEEQWCREPVLQRRRAKHWREGHPLQQRINQALFDTLRDLLRPVYIRDVALNILGPVPHSAKVGREVKRSKYAGYGVPLTAMDALIAEDKSDE